MSSATAEREELHAELETLRVRVREFEREQAAHRRAEQALRELAETERALRRELNHRLRNNLISLITLTELTGRSSPDALSCAASIRGRVQGMSLVHTLLSAGGGHSMRFGGLLQSLVPTDHAGKVRAAGPDLTVNSAECHKLGMVINELFTNSLKHGALGAKDGVVEATWTAHPLEGNETRVAMRWEESGGPPIRHAPKPGLGAGIVEGLLRSDLRGRAELTFPPCGARHRLELILSAPASESPVLAALCRDTPA